MPKTVHVFSGVFGSREKACLYSEEQWEVPAPDDSWSEEAYSAWEERNPSWLLDRDLKVEYLSPDFIETIFGPDKIDYLERQLANEADRRKLRAEISEQDDTLVLIYSPAFEGKEARLSLTPRLKYHGEYVWDVE
jgi:hypothetical protein